MSPELFRNAPYGAKSDVWALGIVIYELCTLKHPFDAQSISALATKILKGVYEPVPMAYSRNIRLLVKKMLTLAPEGRPTIGTFAVSLKQCPNKSDTLIICSTLRISSFTISLTHIFKST